MRGVDDQRNADVAAHRPHLRGGLNGPPVTAQRGDVNQRRWIGRQRARRRVHVEPAGGVDGQRPHLESVPLHRQQVGAVLAGQAGQRPWTAPVREEDLQRVVRAGGEDDVTRVVPGERRNGGPARVEHGRRGLGGDVAADLGLVAGVGGGRVDRREGLPRARRAVQV